MQKAIAEDWIAVYQKHYDPIDGPQTRDARAARRRQYREACRTTSARYL
jgi:hypothetical protein